MGSTVTDRIAGVSTSVAIKAPVQDFTIANISLSGLSVQAGGNWSADLSAGNRILVLHQANPVENGIYVASTSEWQRASDFNGSRDVVKGTLVGVDSSGDQYKVSSENPVTVGVSGIEFSLFPDGRVYENVAALIASGASLGGYVTTAGYTESGDGLGEDYEIVNVDGPGHIALDNGLYAKPLGNSAPRPAVDLFVVAGQSNAEGRGDVLESPDAPHGLSISGSTITYPLSDPLGGASTGSMWPSFSNEWFNQTGNMSAFVEAAQGGTGLLAGAGGQWGPSGSLRGDAVSAANDAINAIVNSEAYNLGKVYFIWSQGEADAASINGTTVTGELYEQALEDLADYFKANVPSMETMGVVMIGSNGTPGGLLDYSSSTTQAYQEIRLAQKRACDDSANLTLAYSGTYSFFYRYLSYDGLHYNQKGLNIAGKCAAKQMRYAQPLRSISPYLGSEVFDYTFADNGTSTVTTRTETHETVAFTRSILVIVSSARVSNSANYSISAEVNGAPMLNVTKTEAQSSGRCQVHSFLLTEKDYGRSIDRISAEITVTASSSQNFLAFSVIDLKDVFEADSEGSLFLSSVTEDSPSVSISTYFPAIIVNGMTSIGEEASPVTASVTGATEIADTGWTNEVDRNSTMHVSYSTENVPVEEKAVDLTLSADQTAIALCAISIRPYIRGEI